MEIYMQKIELDRPNSNPKSKQLDLDIDWVVEYDDITQDQMTFDIVLKSCKNFTLNFKIEGIVKLDSFEKLVQDEISQKIFHQSIKVLMDMISITRESTHDISNTNESELYNLIDPQIHNALFN
jgi:hypothetical protein